MSEFDIRLYYGGRMSFLPKVNYNGGKMTLTHEDPDKLSVFEMKGILDELGYKEPKKMWYRVPNKALASGLNSMDSDNEVMNMAELGLKHGMIDVYVEVDPKDDGGNEIVPEMIEEQQLQEDESDVDLEDKSETDSEWDARGSGAETDYGSEEDNEEYVCGRKLKLLQKEVQGEDCADGEDITEVGRRGKVRSGTVTEENEGDVSSSDELMPQISDDENNNASILKLFNDKIPKQDIKFEVGLAFESTDQFKQAMVDCAIFNGVGIIWRRSCEQRLEAVCKNADCKWRVLASWLQNREAFVVKVIQSKHTCSRTAKNKQCSAKWLAGHYLERFRANPDWSISEFMNDVCEKFAIKVSRTVCYKARAIAKSLVMGSLEDHYNLLPTYLQQLMNVYEKSTFDLVLDRSDHTSGPRFKRFYLCFEGLTEGFLHGCRRIIGLDGCFLKTSMGGQLLSVVGRDGNNQMFPFSWAVVENENESSWRWFVDHLIDDLGISSGLGWIIISDQQKGLENAVKSLLPEVEHRNCARHLYANWKKKHPGIEMKSIFWKAVKATNQQTCLTILDHMKVVSKEAYDDFTAIGLHKFCRAFISNFSKCDVVDNNISECFDNFILKPRCLPIIDMLEDIRTALMERHARKSSLMAAGVDDICPRIRKKLEENKFKYRSCLPTNACLYKFQVDEFANRYVVNLANQSCSCGEWNVSGIPCIHAISCIYWMNEDPDMYVDELFKREMYLRAYEHPIAPMNGKNLWKKVEGETVLPPLVKRQAGRPRKQRKRHPSEKEPDKQVLSKKGVLMKCSTCKQVGHNSRYYPDKGKAVASTSSIPQVRKRGRPPKLNNTVQGSTSSGQAPPAAKRAYKASNNQVRKKKPGPARKAQEATGSTNLAAQGTPSSGLQTSDPTTTRAPKLQVRRKNTGTSENAQRNIGTDAAIFHKEMAKAKTGYGVFYSEATGMSFYRMPGEMVRTSYMGRLGGQFSQGVTSSGQSGTTQQQASQLSERSQITSSQQSASTEATQTGPPVLTKK